MWERKQNGQHEKGCIQPSKSFTTFDLGVILTSKTLPYKKRIHELGTTKIVAKLIYIFKSMKLLLIAAVHVVDHRTKSTIETSFVSEKLRLSLWL